MAKKKKLTKSSNWYRKTFDKKTSFAILAFVVFLYLVILICYTIISFNNSIYGSKSLSRIIAWDMLGIYNSFIPTPTPYPVKPSTPLIIPSPTEQPIEKKEYVSNRLGISFQYISFSPAPESKSGGDYTFVREISNTIYIYWIPGENQPFTGSDADFLSSLLPQSRYVEVFYKDPNQSLVDAIKQKMFGDNIPSQCYISTRYVEPNINGTYQQAVILEYSRPKTRDYSYQENINYILSCTQYASNYGGKSYFMMNPQHADRFLYIHIGQSNFPIWDGTITIN